jgi:hypothetical protein
MQYLEKFTSDINHYVPKNVSKYRRAQNRFYFDTEDMPEYTANTPKLQEQLAQT